MLPDDNCNVRRQRRSQRRSWLQNYRPVLFPMMVTVFAPECENLQSDPCLHRPFSQCGHGCGFDCSASSAAFVRSVLQGGLKQTSLFNAFWVKSRELWVEFSRLLKPPQIRTKIKVYVNFSQTLCGQRARETAILQRPAARDAVRARA